MFLDFHALFVILVAALALDRQTVHVLHARLTVVVWLISWFLILLHALLHVLMLYIQTVQHLNVNYVTLIVKNASTQLQIVRCANQLLKALLFICKTILVSINAVIIYSCINTNALNHVLMVLSRLQIITH